MNECKELNSLKLIKSQISEIDRLIFVLTNKGGKAKALKKAQELPWSYIEGMIEENHHNVQEYMNNGQYSLENRSVSLTMYGGESVVTKETEDLRFKIQNSFDWTLHELLNGAFPVKRYPVHTRKNIKRIECMFKFHHGIKLDWNLAANHFPEFFPGTKTAPKRLKGGVYKHSKKRGYWVGEDMIVLPMLLKLKILRAEAVSFYLDLEMKMTCKKNPEAMHDALKTFEGAEGFNDASFLEKIAAQGGIVPEVFLPTTLVR